MLNPPSSVHVKINTGSQGGQTRNAKKKKKKMLGRGRRQSVLLPPPPPSPPPLGQPLAWFLALDSITRLLWSRRTLRGKNISEKRRSSS